MTSNEIAQASQILRFADDLPGPYGYESSIKFTGGGLSSQRFLVSFPKVALQMGTDLEGLLTCLDFPAQGFCSLAELLSFGDILHLGFEQEGAVVCKLYVEAARDVREQWEVGVTHTEVTPVHRAYKWQVGQQALIKSLYDWLPCNSARDLMAKMLTLCALVSAESLSPLLSYLAQRCSVSDLQLLRVSEVGSPRLSFDLNVYDADCTVGQIAPYVQSLLGKHTPSSFQRLPRLGIGQQRCGHLAAGTSRTGEPFVTLYYGGQERGGFSSQS